jgi:hypothetical protein
VLTSALDDFGDLPAKPLPPKAADIVAAVQKRLERRYAPVDGGPPLDDPPPPPPLPALPALPAPKKGKKKARGAGGQEAERIVEAWLELEGWEVHRAAAAGAIKDPKTGRHFVKSHDIFGCLDMVAIKPGAKPDTRGVQVTTATGKSARRRKIEGHRWPPTWQVLLVSHEVTEDPAHRRRLKHFLKVEEFRDGKWSEPRAVAIDKAMIDAHRSTKWAAKREKASEL